MVCTYVCSYVHICTVGVHRDRNKDLLFRNVIDGLQYSLYVCTYVHIFTVLVIIQVILPLLFLPFLLLSAGFSLVCPNISSNFLLFLAFLFNFSIS